ncbi:MAG: DUF899 family protein [Gammaproteobacteria bacterium]
MAFNIHQFQFPNESEQYRQARNELLEAEIALRAQIEKVAAMRRELPPGGLTENYEFSVASANEEPKIKLLDLFSPSHNTLIAYNYMFAPDADDPCPLCTSFVDGLNGLWPHIAEHVSLAVIAKSPTDKLKTLRRERGWHNVQLLSSFDNSFQRDYAGETATGQQMPMMNVFIKANDQVRHFWGSEMLFAPSDWDSRHIDMQWPLWHFFDITPEGRGAQRYPKLAY